MVIIVYFFYDYALFSAKVITLIILFITMVVIFLQYSTIRNNKNGEIQITVIKKDTEDIKNNILCSTMSKIEKKQWIKTEKKRLKEKQNQDKEKIKKNVQVLEPILYVLDFKGSSSAKEVSSLRKEISAIISVAKKQDEVLLRLESAGGIVNGYGLAASQLQRLKDNNIYLTVVVDKIAASGGYMMACVADHIVAAPFSIIGSIGVISLFPNFYKLLKKHNIDIELHTAGKFKRNLTIFGENTELGRQKMQQELNNIHDLFKNFVHSMRPNLNIESVSNGEYWFGSIALEKGLIDSINTSDDVIFNKSKKFKVIKIKLYCQKPFLNSFLKIITSYIINLYKFFLK
ncbi:MAG: protease SohB [Buchnera aphidicola (Eriosoma harunire)]